MAQATGSISVMWLAVADVRPAQAAADDDRRGSVAAATKLSAETRKRLEDKPPVEQWQLVAGWMRPGPRRPNEDRRMHGPLPKDDDERLAEFFEKDLSPEERDRLLAMPGEEMQWRLQQMYQCI